MSKHCIAVVLLVLGTTGCFLVRPPSPESIPPEQVVTYYLRNITQPSMQRELYDLLTATAKKAIPYPAFVSLRNNEIPALLGSGSGAETRVLVSVFDQHEISSDHAVVYALMTVRHPYSLGEREKYALVRLHSYREGGQWTIEPFMHEPTGTVLLVPTRLRGPLWRISDDMEKIARLVREEISKYEERQQPPVEKVVEAESPEEPPLVIPDVLAEMPREEPPPELEAGNRVAALISIGRLCYEAGRIDAAEDTFRRVLALDPDSSIAKDYLSRCQNYRILLKEKGDAAKLIEELLELESKDRPPK
ncbi:MAG: tetratricopeptide repeat protein [bacterium]|nr:tetratricopeptide repeat protein [bacterium]